MPFYEIHHACTLTDSQKQDLATSITTLHTTTFNTPRLIVNIRFSPLPDSDSYFIAGKLRKPNQIFAHVRTGGGRSTQQFNELCADVTKAWDEICGQLPKVKRSAPDQDRSLGGVFVLGDIVAGMEKGFPIPETGKDGEWMEEHMEEFKKRAEAGDEDFVELLEDVERMKGASNGNGSKRTTKEDLEEALGWGDSA